jgi:hypothetical protein
LHSGTGWAGWWLSRNAPALHLESRAVSGRSRRWVVTVAAGVPLALVAVIAVRAFRDPEPSPQVRRLLPKVVLFLEHKDPLSLLQAQGRPPSNWTLYCSVRYLGNTPPREQFNLYVWQVCQAYRVDGKQLAKGSGWSVPAAIWLVKTQNGYLPRAEHQPNTDEDDAFIFPENLRDRIFEIQGSELVGTMEAETKRRACTELLSTPTCRAHN